MFVLDIHAHILPATWPSLKERYGYGGFIVMDHHRPGAARMMRDDGTFFREVQQNCWDPEHILMDMDRHGVNVMTLCTVPVLFSYWARPEDCSDWSRFLNDHLANVVQTYPKRFVGLGTVPMQNTDMAILEMERCVKELGMPGLQIGSNILGRNLDDPALKPFYAAAQDLGACLMVHPWEMAGSNRMKSYFQEWLVGMPAETTLAITSMIFGGIFEEFPRLRVLFAHAGGAFPFTMGRISHGWHARPDLCNIHQIKDPRAYARSFWVDGITHDDAAFRYLLEMSGPDRVCYGTDYPFPLGDLEHGKFLHQMDISPSVKEQVFSRSALDFLGLDIEQFL
jgi:aminocarboxymuconate-semialdehyde decarboxylase